MELPVTPVIDATGTWCPVPIVELAKAVRAAAVGTRLELVATDPAIESDLKAWCEATGHELVFLRREAGIFRAQVCVRG